MADSGESNTHTAVDPLTQEAVPEDAPTTTPAIKKKRRIAIDYVIEKNYDNEYIQNWLALPFIPTIREDPNFHSLLNHKELKKEMSESYAVFVRVQQLIKRLYLQTCDKISSSPSSPPPPSSSSSSNNNNNNNNNNSNDNIDNNNSTSSTSTVLPTLEEFTQNIVLFDICSGKGYSATLLTFMFPTMKIFMIDKDTKMNINHLKSLPNIQMAFFDMFKKEKIIEFVTKQTKNKIGLFVGTHLCGELSEIFVDMYNRIDELNGLVLAPCCLSKTRRNFTDTAAKLKVDNYDYWTMHLYWMIQQSKKDICVDENVFSARNSYILAVKNKV